MKCKDVEKRLVRYLEKELPESIQANIENHLMTCDHCSQLSADFGDIWCDLEITREVQPNPFFYTRIQQRINEYEQNRRSPAKWIMSYAQPCLAGLTVITGIILGYWLGNSQTIQIKNKSNFDQFLDAQVGDLPPDSIADFYLTVESDN